MKQVRILKRMQFLKQKMHLLKQISHQLVMIQDWLFPKSMVSQVFIQQGMLEKMQLMQTTEKNLYLK